MPGDVFLSLAQFAGQTLAGAAISDVWEAAKGRFARLWGRGDPRRTEVAERWLSDTHEQIAAATDSDIKLVLEAAAERWAIRFSDLLDEDPGVEVELRALVADITAQLPAEITAAGDHSIAVGRDLNIGASSGGIAAGVIHGNVMQPNPTTPGPAQQ
jgi:hypothetical protein